ncbi:ankyrin repeat-containing domain protein [Staphylotrichum tortipilum]|uniref:Ankyrin repeat-containing domain protein n=1 Tax=Staphylotrichum tortipilum TaxID=2831512 RepID=A0AAN6MIM1_9PEZI|nr:ankyrin repeat-containing domain protein [Staphylotrichum longicolle]
MPSQLRITRNASCTFQRTSYGLTPYLEHLISREGAAAVTRADVDGETPLFHSAKAGHTAVVKLLLAVGADPNPEDRSGHKPLHLAAKNNHAGVVTALLAAGVSPLTEKTREGPRTTFPLPGGPRTKGSTPLMYACRAGHVAAVEAFLPWIHDIGTVHWALDWASRAGEAQVVKRLFLLLAGADMHRRDGFSQTPLHHAAHQPALLRLLLRASADPNVESKLGGTLLHTQLSLEGGWEVVKLLVEEGKANINKRRLRDGKTPFMAMIDKDGDLNVGVRFIHAFGPDCTIADNASNCPPHAAAQCGHEWGESCASPWDKLVDPPRRRRKGWPTELQARDSVGTTTTAPHITQESHITTSFLPCLYLPQYEMSYPLGV